MDGVRLDSYSKKGVWELRAGAAASVESLFGMIDCPT